MSHSLTHRLADIKSQLVSVTEERASLRQQLFSSQQQVVRLSTLIPSITSGTQVSGGHALCVCLSHTYTHMSFNAHSVSVSLSHTHTPPHTHTHKQTNKHTQALERMVSNMESRLGAFSSKLASLDSTSAPTGKAGTSAEQQQHGSLLSACHKLADCAEGMADSMASTLAAVDNTGCGVGEQIEVGVVFVCLCVWGGVAGCAVCCVLCVELLTLKHHIQLPRPQSVIHLCLPPHTGVDTARRLSQRSIWCAQQRHKHKHVSRGSHIHYHIIRSFCKHPCPALQRGCCTQTAGDGCSCCYGSEAHGRGRMGRSGR